LLLPLGHTTSDQSKTNGDSMNPIRFGDPARELFAIYQHPVAGTCDHAVLLCNPFGQEAIRSHRLFRVLADRLCRQGYPVMRFDYFGTGDSAGDGDALSLGGLVKDIATAQAELARRSGARTFTWLGLRLGATAALLASKSGAPGALPPARLILWEPVIDGKKYLAELEDAQNFALEEAFGARCHIDPDFRSLIAAERGKEALGFPLSAAFRAEIESLSPTSFAGAQIRAANVYALPAETGGDDSGTLAFTNQMQSDGVDVRLARVNERVVWTADEMMNSATVPGEVLQTISSCFSEAAV
jgi:uncharacterized protein